MEKRQKRQAHSTSFAIFEACADLAPASWSAAVPSAALDFSEFHRRQQRTEVEKGETGFLHEGAEVTELDRRKPRLFASFPLFASVQDCDVEAKAPEKTGALQSFAQELLLRISH